MYISNFICIKTENFSTDEIKENIYSYVLERTHAGCMYTEQQQNKPG